MTPFQRVYVQAAAGDAGGAIGAAFAVWHKLGGKRNFVMDHAYWGPAFDDAEVAQALDGPASRDIAAAAVVSNESLTRRRYASAPPRRLPTARSSAGFRDAWNGVRARSAIARSCATRAEPI